MFVMKALLLLLVVLSTSARSHYHKHPHHHHHHAHDSFPSSDAASTGFNLGEKFDDFNFQLRSELKDKDSQEGLAEALFELSKTPFFQWYVNPLLLKASPQDVKIQLSNRTSADFNENQITTTEQFQCHREALSIASFRCRSSCEHEYELLSLACNEHGPTSLSAYSFFTICCSYRLDGSANNTPKARKTYPTELVEKYLSEKYSSEENEK